MGNARQHYPPDKVTTTPSGVRIEFYDARQKTDEQVGQKRHYLVDGEQFVSVTAPLEILDKPALKSWAQRLGVRGAITLAKDGGLPQNEDAAISRMKGRNLCWWQTRDQAAERGTLAHEDLVRLGLGEVPDLSAVPVEQRGYVQGVCAWYADYRPTVLEQEQMVASPRHGFAGRLDLRARFDVPALTGTALVDLKTTERFPRDKQGRIRPPFREAALQLEAYELASVECGYEPTDFRLILRVESTGAYDVAFSWATADDYLVVLETYRTMRELDSRQPAAIKAAA